MSKPHKTQRLASCLQDHVDSLAAFAGRTRSDGPCLLYGKAMIEWKGRCDARTEGKKGKAHEIALLRNEIDHWETYLKEGKL